MSYSFDFLHGGKYNLVVIIIIIIIIIIIKSVETSQGGKVNILWNQQV
jgi:hypothetical protein